MLKMNEGYRTDVEDIDGMLDAILDFIFVYDYDGACELGIIDAETSDFDEDAVDEFREDLINCNGKLAEYLYSIIKELEPGERYDGKIDDILDYLEGYAVGDSREPMATRSEFFESMNRVNESEFDKWCLKNVAPKVGELVKKVQKDLASGDYDTDDLDGIVSAVASNVFNLVTDAVAPYVEKKQTNEAYDYDYVNTITADQMDDAVEEGYPVKVVISGEYYDYQPTRGMYESLDENEEEKPDDDFVDGKEKTDDKMTESLSGFKRLPVKQYVSEFSKPNDSVQAPAQVEDEVADESFAHDDSM